MTKWPTYDGTFIRRRYNRIAPIFPVFEWIFLLPPWIRRRMIERMELKPGDRVLEVGCGTGRNFPGLIKRIGPRGHLYGIDISEGMLDRAKRRCARAGWMQVTVMRGDATECSVPEPVDVAVFSLSYCVIPRPQEALRWAWSMLKPGGRLVIMDAKLPPGRRGRLMRPLFMWISRLTVLGDPDLKPWEDLRELADQVDMQELFWGTYFICTGVKRD
ncbi:MAG: class I SAM-dependent methyltransferase [Planctomycetota bacterium]|jgi:demethylmenaquinone methyltransferase/2-methoxy-6-polyprenyl-1,4-benzoquinol methylase